MLAGLGASLQSMEMPSQPTAQGSPARGAEAAGDARWSASSLANCISGDFPKYYFFVKMQTFVLPLRCVFSTRNPTRHPGFQRRDGLPVSSSTGLNHSDPDTCLDATHPLRCVTSQTHTTLPTLRWFSSGEQSPFARWIFLPFPSPVLKSRSWLVRSGSTSC